MAIDFGIVKFEISDFESILVMDKKKILVMDKKKIIVLLYKSGNVLLHLLNERLVAKFSIARLYGLTINFLVYHFGDSI